MHGSHWDTVVPEADRERSIQTATMGAIQNGEPTAGQPLDGEEVTGYTDLEGPVGTRTVSVGGQVYTSYPFAEGIQADASVEEFHEWTNGIEAWASLAVGPASVTAFATDYFSYHDGAPEAPASVAVTGFCYQLRPADDDSAFEDALDAPALDDDFVGLFPWDRGGPDDYVLRTTVEEVTRIDADAFDGSVLRVPLFRRDDAPDPVLPLVVADHVAGNFDPAAGDDITAVLWLQAEIDA